MPDPVTIPAGDIAFYDNYIPSLKGDIYDIFVASSVSGVDTQGYFANPISQRFEVRAPQFTLDTTEIHSVYPPSNSNAVFDQVVPHIVLETPALPWERYLDTTDNTLPWMALVVFAEGEIAVDPVSLSSLSTIQVSDLLQAASGVVRPAISPVDVPTDVLNGNCQTITISANAFNALVPSSSDLKYLAHVRQVNTGSQVAIGGLDDIGWFSVVVGNRLLSAAQGGTRFYVHLVSLEGFLPYINGSQTIPAGQNVQMVSLYNWSFISQPEVGTSFKDLAENFVSQAQGNPANLLFRKNVSVPSNPDASMEQVVQRMNNGYVALNWQMPTGENSFGWYRGPFSPVIAQSLPRPADTPHYPSASATMIYDSASGIFDHSYSAAWSMGRALALSDGTFGPAMLNWRRKNYSLLGKMLDYFSAQGVSAKADLSAIISGNTVMNAFDQLMAGNLGAQLTSLIHQPVKEKRSAKLLVNTTPPPDPVQLAQQYLAMPDVQALMKSEVSTELKTIASWIARKQLLYDVPFNQLVPDPEMLPAESLRVFYIDQNWLDVLTDGALSLGIQGSKDAFITQAMRGVIDDAVKDEIQNIRSQITGISTGDIEADSPLEAMSGVLIRSAMISGWPSLQVTGTYQGQALKTLRMDHLADNVLLVIFLDIPDTITLAEPQQGLRFGVEDGSIINLRYITGENVGQTISGKTFPVSGSFQNYFRAPIGGIGGSVLNINSGSPNLINDMTSAYPQAPQTFRPSEFAVQMVKAPEQLSFNPPAALTMLREEGLISPAKIPAVVVPPQEPPSENPEQDQAGLSFWERIFRWLLNLFKAIISVFTTKKNQQ